MKGIKITARNSAGQMVGFGCLFLESGEFPENGEAERYTEEKVKSLIDGADPSATATYLGTSKNSEVYKKPDPSKVRKVSMQVLRHSFASHLNTKRDGREKRGGEDSEGK